MAIIHRRLTEKFTSISNAILADKRLSWKARGILAYMLSMKEDWQFYTTELAKHSDKDGLSAIKTGIQELEKVGYLKRVQSHDNNGKFSTLEWILTDAPAFSPQVENPLAVKPPTEKPQADNRPLTNTNLNKDLSKQRLIENSASELAPHSLIQLEKDFEEVWKEYPNKKGKKQAFSHYKAWRKKSKSNTNAYLLERLKKYKAWASKQFSGYQYLNGSTWFNGRFDDDYGDASPKALNVDYSDWHSLDNSTTNSNFY